jgi:hypothetical protein
MVVGTATGTCAGVDAGTDSGSRGVFDTGDIAGDGSGSVTGVYIVGFVAIGPVGTVSSGGHSTGG